MVHPIWDDFPTIQSELLEVRKLMLDELTLQYPLLREKIEEYILAPGKYLRAGLVLLFAQMQPQGITSEKKMMAAGIELFHLATLIHDDVIDDASVRRGIQAMHIEHSNRVAVYAGDYLMSYSARMMGSNFREELLDLMNHRIVENILKGELSQLTNQFNQSMTMVDYLRQIRHKTGLLFALSTASGYDIPGVSKRQLMNSFYAGESIGYAFQLSDDLLDLTQSIDKIGKPEMQDIQNGIYTAPIIYTMNQKESHLKTILSKERPLDDSDISLIVSELEHYQSFDYTKKLIERNVKNALKYIHRLAPEKISEFERLFLLIYSRNY